MPMLTRCDGDLTTITRTPDGWHYTVAAPLATYVGTVDTLDEALVFALTGFTADELGPDAQITLALRD